MIFFYITRVQQPHISELSTCTVKQGWIHVWHLAINGFRGHTNTRESMREAEEKSKWKGKPKDTVFLFCFFSCFSKKLMGDTKACVLIFSFRAPPGPLKRLWFPQSNYISILNPFRIATSHQGTLSAYKRSMLNGVPEVDFISLLQSNGLWYFPKLMAALPQESIQRCMGPEPATQQPTASPFNHPLQSLLLSVWNNQMASPPPLSPH